MGRCTFRHDGVEAERACPREAHTDHDRCRFHISPDERHEAGITNGDVREAFRSDIRSGDDRRRTLAGARFETVDLSSLVIDGEDRDRIVLRDITVDGTLDLSAAVVGHPLELIGCDVGHLDVTGATFEAAVTITDSTFGTIGNQTTCVTARRATFEDGLDITSTELVGAAEFAGVTIDGWFTVEDTVFTDRAHFPRVSLSMVQFIDVSFEAAVGFDDARVEHLAIEEARFASSLDLSAATIGTVRCRPAGDATVRLNGTAVSGGRLEQPDDERVLYDLAGATVGDIELDCTAATFDRYRFFRTQFDGFGFAAYRDVLRANAWRLHEYAGESDYDIESLELTYLEAKQGATGVGDNETASAFFIREMRYRRGRYAAHARDPAYTATHRLGATVRWATSAFLGLLAGYGERPARVLLTAVTVIVGASLAYPALGGLDTGDGIVTYASDGAGAILESLYFSVVTFTTLGLGDIEPIGQTGRLLVGGEALAGAFLTALFVFTLGRSVTR